MFVFKYYKPKYFLITYLLKTIYFVYSYLFIIFNHYIITLYLCLSTYIKLVQCLVFDIIIHFFFKSKQYSQIKFSNLTINIQFYILLFIIETLD